MEQQILLLDHAIREKLKVLAKDDGRSISKYGEHSLQLKWDAFRTLGSNKNEEGPNKAVSSGLKTKDLRLYISLPIRAYKDKRLWRYKKTFFILAALCSYTDVRGMCSPNQSTLAEEFECSR